MDFGELLHMAKKNSSGSNKNEGKFYCTKFAPPKKETKESKRLSENIKKFLQRRDQEEQERQRKEKEKLANLLAMRDEKSKNKIKKMLKVTKSANKSVLDDAVSSSHTAVTLDGPEQPDQDDYGYVSNEANAFYQKYIEKVKDVKEDKGFAPSRPQSVRDLSGTKERVKAALNKEIDDKKGSSRIRVSHVDSGKATSTPSASVHVSRSSKPIYDPDAERKEDERKRREEQEKKAKNRKPVPPPMDFHALLKLAEKKQHEPVELEVQPKKKEPERLLTSKEKRELEERERAKRERQERDRNGDRKEVAPIKMEPNGRIPKLNQAPKPTASSGNTINSATKNLSRPDVPQGKPTVPSNSNGHIQSGSNGMKKPQAPAKPSSGSGNSKVVSTNANPRSASSSSKPAARSASSSSSTASGSSAAKTTNGANASAFSNGKSSSNGSATRNPYNGPTREFPPRDIKATKTRAFPPADVQRNGSNRPSDSSKQKSLAPKRRIMDDDDEDDEDYDSELDDFIDDGDCEEDYSTHIRAIFGYDKSKYRYVDEEDDAAMESSFAQVQREEYISKKIGIQEDLEDMKLEALEKKRKMMKKRRLS